MFQRIKCWLNYHAEEKIVESAYLIYEKGNRQIDVFAGHVSICECGEDFNGPLTPWFTGTWEQFYVAMSESMRCIENTLRNSILDDLSWKEGKLDSISPKTELPKFSWSKGIAKHPDGCSCSSYPECRVL